MDIVLRWAADLSALNALRQSLRGRMLRRQVVPTGVSHLTAQGDGQAVATATAWI